MLRDILYYVYITFCGLALFTWFFDVEFGFEITQIGPFKVNIGYNRDMLSPKTDVEEI